MKIAIIGSRPSDRLEVVEKIKKKWTSFISPDFTVTSPLEDGESLDNFAKKCISSTDLSHANGVMSNLASDEEREIYLRARLAQKQLKDNSLKKNVVFNGCVMDLLLNAICGGASEALIRTLMRINKQIMKKLDLVYIVPSVDYDLRMEAEYDRLRQEAITELKEKGEEFKEDEVEVDESKVEMTDDDRLEMVYRNFLDSFFANPDGNDMFPSEGAAMEQFFSRDYINELDGIIDEKGNLRGEGSAHDPEEIDKLMRLFKGKTKTDVLNILMGDNKVYLDNSSESE